MSRWGFCSGDYCCCTEPLTAVAWCGPPSCGRTWTLCLSPAPGPEPPRSLYSDPRTGRCPADPSVTLPSPMERAELNISA